MPTKRRKLRMEKINAEMNTRLIPKLWLGNTAFLLGGGPGLLDVDLNLLKDRRVIAVNNSYGLPVKNSSGKTLKYSPLHWVDAVWFGDVRWFGWHRTYLSEYSGLIAHCTSSEVVGLLQFKRGKMLGIERRPGYVSWNRSSGASAINFAFHLGVKRVVLIGYDMRRVDGKKNWHEDHKSGPPPDEDPYQRFLLAFPPIKRDADRFGLEIINCTPNSAITQFPIMTLKEYLANEVNLC